MSRYNQYGYYYDPVGSQSNQPTGYTYQSGATSASAYPTASNSSSYQYGGNAYGSQQYGSGATQQASSSASHAAATLSSLSNQTYSQTTPSSRSGTSGHYENTNWYGSGSNTNAYGSSNVPLPNRSQSNTSPLYASTQNASTFGRLSVPEQTQNSSSTFGASQSSSYHTASSNAGPNSYQAAYTHPASQPPRYNSPLQAARAQQHGQSHDEQPSRSSGHKPSPQMAQDVHSATQNVTRQHSASVEPSQTTVDPSQVYDNRAELQRKAQKDAEKRRKHEAEQAAKKAEEERVDAEKRKVEEERQKAEKEAAKKEEQDRKKKAREEKKQSKSAATALAKMASSGSAEGASSAPPADDEEAEMRAMFQKMREFNAKNPAMLAKLWEEERRSHSQSQSPQAAKASLPAVSKEPAQWAAHSAASTSASSPNRGKGVRSFKPPIEPPKPAKPTTAASSNAPRRAPSQPITQASSQASTSLWPPHKKGTLADATAKWLRSQPQNANSMLTAQTVLNILDKNPSYVQLCESLEALGLKFERAALARELLRAVPDGLKAQPAPNARTSLATPTAALDAVNQQAHSARDELGHARQASESGPRTVNYEAPLSLTDPASDRTSMARPSYQSPHGRDDHQSPYLTQARPVSAGSRAPTQSQPPEIKPEIKPEEPPRPPADKEEAARKRTFGDLVDLTAEDSEDDVTGPPPKKFAVPSSAPTFTTVNGTHTQHTAAHCQPGPPQLKQYIYQPPAQNESRPGLSSWQAQVPVPSNGQANGMPHAAQQAAIVPSQPHRPKGPSAEQLQQARMKGKMLVEPIMRDRVARKSKYDSRTIARDVLLATGRHPDMRGLNAHLVAMQKLLAAHGGEIDSGASRADLSTVKWDIIDPEPPKEQDGMKRPVTAESNDTNPLDLENAHREKTAVKPPVPRPISTTAHYESPAPAETVGVKAKRGRPPKYSLSGSKSPTSLTNGLGKTPRQTSSRPATPSSAPAPSIDAKMSSTKPVGYSQFRQYADDGTEVKKKGRPIGWRKNLHSREAQGLAPATLPSRLKEKKTTFTSAKKQQQEQIAQPQYQVYRCEWSGCKAELHNLETLKKHLIKVHGPKPGQDWVAECWWKGCGAQTRHEGKVKTFTGIEPWVEHLEREHLRPVAWRLGDGPGVRDLSSEPAQPPAYLFDENGRAVTPVITPTPPRTNATTAPTATANDAEATPPPPQPAVQRLGRGRPPKDGISKAERDLGAPLKKLEEHQRAVGPIMDRMGCVLADEGRRAVFLDDEDFEDEVYGSEYDAREEG